MHFQIKAERNSYQTYTTKNVNGNSSGWKKMTSDENLDLHEKLGAPEI